MIIVEVIGVVSDEGSLVVLEGFEVDETGDHGDVVKFATERRYAQDIADAVEEGETAICGVDEWQVISRTKLTLGE